MFRTRYFLPVLVGVAVVAVFVGVARAQTLSVDMKELAGYRLTLPTVKKVAAVTKSLAEEAAQDPRVKELARIRLEITEIEKKEDLTEAEDAQVEKLREREQALEDQDESSSSSWNNAQSLADMEAKIRQHPGWMRALTREGVTPREYARCMMALMQASMVEGFSQGKADLANLPAGVNPENLRFVRENKAELEAILAAMSGKSKK